MWRSQFFLLLLICGFVILLVRLIDISFIRGQYYTNLSQGNRIRRITLYAPRGIIYDKNGIALTANEKMSKIVRFEAGKPVQFTDSDEITDPTKEAKVDYTRRNYPEGDNVAHAVGYISEANSDEVEKIGCPGSIYSLGDLVGRSGIEEALDCQLRGRNGEELVEVDTRGRKIRSLGRVEPVAGSDVYTSIDVRLERRARLALEGKKGAVVALNPKNGEILALISSPTFDPNLIKSKFSVFASDKDQPMFDRAISGVYPPGSTFKIITAAAGLEDEKIDENFHFLDEGFIKVGAFTFRNWYFTMAGKTEGEIDLVHAITRSTDTFFYKVGELVGVDRLGFWAKKLGLGQRTGIELPGERDGIVPTPDWKERFRGERWFLGNTYHMAIGQGDIAVSPIQIAAMTSVIASGGKWCRPTIQRMEDGKWKMENCHDVGLAQKTLDLIHKGMDGACSQGGTSLRFINFAVNNSKGQQKVHVSCKTGTAEFAGSEDTHAWFTAFASKANDDGTFDDPEIVITVLVEKGGEGSTAAAPVAKEVLEEWFSGQ